MIRKRRINIAKSLFILLVLVLLYIYMVGNNFFLHHYNFGIRTTSEEFLSDVNALFTPKGEFGAGSLNSRTGAWLMHEIYWPVPKEIKVCFRDPEGNNHELKAFLSLPRYFRGDILIVIHKDKAQYVLRIFTGSLQTLLRDEHELLKRIRVEK